MLQAAAGFPTAWFRYTTVALFDCGLQGAMCRGTTSGIWAWTSGGRAILLSHGHPDHYVGLPAALDLGRREAPPGRRRSLGYHPGRRRPGYAREGTRATSVSATRRRRGCARPFATCTPRRRAGCIPSHCSGLEFAAALAGAFPRGCALDSVGTRESQGP